MSETGEQLSFVSVVATVRPDRIGYCKFIVEAYDNLAVLSTVDAGQGIIVLRFSPESRDEVCSLLDVLGATLSTHPGQT
jgi:hypothetical protein